MVKVEVSIISEETITPSSPTVQHSKPYKLSLFDQVTPFTYPPTILFYLSTDPNLDVSQTISHLKKSLSETLTIFYPFFGRIKDNLFVDDFHSGVPFLDASVNCSMSDFLEHQETELLNLFLPCHPFCKEPTDTALPQIAIQLNRFVCGGIAIGLSGSHKVADVDTMSNFLKYWAAASRGSHNELTHPNFTEGSSVFPSRDSLPQSFSRLMDSLWFNEGNYITKRFVFDSKAIANLRGKAKSELVPNPSRIKTLTFFFFARKTCIKTLTGFIWKHSMAASSAAKPSSKKTSLLVQAVNMRPRMGPHLSKNSTGNMFWWAPAAAEMDEKEIELPELVDLLTKSLAGFTDGDSLESLEGDDGFLAVSDFFNQLEEMFSSGKLDVCAYTSWLNYFNDIDFGWGKPFWVGAMGKVGPAFRKLTIFNETTWGDGIEAWVTMEEKEMAVLEKDPAFLAFASPNPTISCP